jgi:hypothetical protein
VIVEAARAATDLNNRSPTRAPLASLARSAGAVAVAVDTWLYISRWR